MYILIITLILPLSNLNAIDIKKYYYYSDTISTKTLGLNGVKKVLFKPKSNTFVINIKEISDKLKQLKIKIDNYNNNYGKNIIFIQKSKLNDRLVKIIKDRYKNNISGLNIKGVYVYTTTKQKSGENYSKLKSISLNYRLNRGSFRLKSNNLNNLFFNYYIDATYKIVKSKNRLEINQRYNSDNAVVVNKNFEFISSKPISYLRYKNYKSRYPIMKNQPLTEHNSVVVPYIKKGDIIKISIKIGNNIDLKQDVIATEDGSIGGYIKAKALNDKLINVYIKSKDKFILK